MMRLALVATLGVAGMTAQDGDPFSAARRAGRTLINREANVPLACYTKTDGRFNPCWACHLQAVYPNMMAGDVELQRAYSFSDTAKTNRWTNAFDVDEDAIAALSPERVRAWIAGDNYAELRDVLRRTEQHVAFRPDLDFHAGFDADGFARDGSGWRALRYKPFPGTFWPTNGATDDVFIRLPERFRLSEGGALDPEIYRENLARVEASIASPPRDRLGLPDRYVGGARGEAVEPGLYPLGTEFLHTVRYVDVEAEDLRSRRVKEVRWSKKVASPDRAGRIAVYDHETEERDAGMLPRFAGSAFSGLRNGFGWVFQGWIEGRAGRLRLQTYEETFWCMGCHSNLSVTVDSTFSLARKVPGDAGWRLQDLRGMPDAPQLGHRRGEVATWIERAGGCDEFRSHATIVGEAADLAELVAPTRERARLLNAAYLLLVERQAFRLGRQPFVTEPEHIWRQIEAEPTGLDPSHVFTDGSSWLDWAAVGRSR